MILEPIVLQNNQNNATITQDGKSPTLVASMGMGGGYVPMIVELPAIEESKLSDKGDQSAAYTLKIRGGVDTYTKSDGKKGTAGKGALIQIEKSATLSTTQDQILFQPE